MSTNKSIQQLLPKFLEKMSAIREQKGDSILAAWADVIGQKLAPQAKAISFEKGVLTVHVKNATLYSLLSQHEKFKLLKNLKDRFPQAEIRNIIFRIG